MNPNVSVIIPVYNAEKYLVQCLNSVLSSDLKSMEIIAVDDGSTDGSSEILKKFQREYGIKVIFKSNGGASKARNAGIETASGKYLGFVDADDWIEPDMYSTLYEAAIKDNADIVFCNIYRNQSQKMHKYMESGIYRDGKIAEQIYPILISNVDEISGKNTLRGSACIRIFRKELIDKWNIRFDDDIVYNEDGLFCIEATIASKCYVYLGDSYLYHNRYVAGSLTKRYIPNLWQRQKGIIDKLNAVVSNSSFDFEPQINKKMMEIAIYCVENECKSDSGKTKREILANIGDIIKNDELQSALRNVYIKKLKKINNGYWWAMRLRSAKLVRAIAQYREKKHNQG